MAADFVCQPNELAEHFQRLALVRAVAHLPPIPGQLPLLRRRLDQFLAARTVRHGDADALAAVAQGFWP